MQSVPMKGCHRCRCEDRAVIHSAAARMFGFTARMYAIVINDVTPAMILSLNSCVVFLEMENFSETHLFPSNLFYQFCYKPLLLLYVVLLEKAREKKLGFRIWLQFSHALV